MPKEINTSKCTINLNLRSLKKKTTLETKHIKKFKFRGQWNAEGGSSHLIGNTNIETSIEKNKRKRKMVDRSDSRKNKMAKLGLADQIQQQIDDQIRMREGAMKLMSACSTLNQALETSKNLLTINGRILGLMSALQRKKKQHVLQEYNRQRSSASSESPEDACMGKIAISDMRIPLMWKDNVHFTGKTGDQSYYAFALIRCGDQVRDTPLYEITSADTDMYFGLTIVFEELPPDFKMDFEVYYTVITSNEAHGIRTPIRSSMNLRTPKKTVHFNAPKFCLAGHVQLTIDDVRRGVISKDLTMSGQGASGVAVLGDIHEFPIHPLELWGQMCFQLAAQPQAMQGDLHSGIIDIKIINGPVNKYFCILRQNFLHCWESEETSDQCDPMHSIELSPDLKIFQMQNDDLNSIQLLHADESILATLKFASSSDCYDWKCALRKQLNNISLWKSAFVEQMHIEEIKRNRLSIPSKASFYDRIKIEEVTNKANKKLSTTEPNGHGNINEAQTSDSQNTDDAFLPEATPTENSDTPLQSATSHADDDIEVGKTTSCENVSVCTSETPLCSNTGPTDPTVPTILDDPDPNLCDQNPPPDHSKQPPLNPPTIHDDEPNPQTLPTDNLLTSETDNQQQVNKNKDDEALLSNQSLEDKQTPTINKVDDLDKSENSSASTVDENPSEVASKETVNETKDVDVTNNQSEKVSTSVEPITPTENGPPEKEVAPDNERNESLPENTEIILSESKSDMLDAAEIGSKQDNENANKTSVEEVSKDETNQKPDSIPETSNTCVAGKSAFASECEEKKSDNDNNTIETTDNTVIESSADNMNSDDNKSSSEPTIQGDDQTIQGDDQITDNSSEPTIQGDDQTMQGDDQITSNSSEPIIQGDDQTIQGDHQTIQGDHQITDETQPKELKQDTIDIDKEAASESPCAQNDNSKSNEDCTNENKTVEANKPDVTTKPVEDNVAELKPESESN